MNMNELARALYHDVPRAELTPKLARAIYRDAYRTARLRKQLTTKGGCAYDVAARLHPYNLNWPLFEPDDERAAEWIAIFAALHLDDRNNTPERRAHSEAVQRTWHKRFQLRRLKEKAQKEAAQKPIRWQDLSNYLSD